MKLSMGGLLAAAILVSACASAGPADRAKDGFGGPQGNRVVLINASSVRVCGVHLWKQSPKPGDARPDYNWIAHEPLAAGARTTLIVVPSDARYNFTAMACKHEQGVPNTSVVALAGSEPEGPLIMKQEGIELRNDAQLVIH